MRSTTPLAVILFCLATIAGAGTAGADNQIVGFNLGYFAVRGDDARVTGDALVVNRQNALPLFFRTEDFNNVVIDGEWIVGIGEFVEAGASIGYYRKTVATVYERLVDSDGSEIDQDLSLRIMPFTATFRVLPLGRHAPIQPYIGAGVGVFNWRYSEIGEFVDSNTLEVFNASYIAKGTDTGPVVLGGIRIPIGDVFATGGEIRYQHAHGSLPSDFLGDKIDLGGYSYSAMFQIRF